MKLPNPKAQVANYSLPSLEKYHGNPLAEAFPRPLEEPNFEQRLYVDKSLPSNLISLHSFDAKDLINDLKKTFIVTKTAYQLYEHIYIQTRSCYGERNPLDANTRRLANEVSSILKSDKLFDIDRSFEYVAIAPSILVSGEAGTGKTVTIRRILDLFPQVIEHTYYRGSIFKEYQIVYMSFDMQLSLSKKALADNFFTELERIVGTKVRKDFVRTGATPDQMLHGMQSAAITYNIGLIHVDEAQHALYRTAQNKEVATLPELEALFNKIGVPIILSTTKDALSIFSMGDAKNFTHKTKLQTVRRLNSVAHVKFPQWHLDSKLTKKFFSLYFSQSVFKETSVDTDEFRTNLLVLCAGIPDAMSALSIAFIRNWLDKVKELKGDIDAIDNIQLLHTVFKFRMDQWHSELERIRASYEVTRKPQVQKGSRPTTKRTDTKIIVEEARFNAPPTPRTTKHQPKPTNKIERIDEGEEVIDADYIVAEYHISNMS